MGLGFYDGLSRFFLDPIRGARDDGGLGFLRGLGSGTLDLIVRSSAGNDHLLDFADSRFMGTSSIYIERNASRNSKSSIQTRISWNTWEKIVKGR